MDYCHFQGKEKMNKKKLKKEIIHSLKDLKLNKIILFGSYATGNYTENSDIDLLIVKNISESKLEELELKARKRLRKIIFNYKVGIDIISVSQKMLKEKNNNAIIQEILSKGEILFSE